MVEQKIEITVISPMYNEEAGIEEAVTSMLSTLSRLDRPWEFIVVNDGSVDRSLEIVTALAKKNPHLRVVSYPVNRGRGYALRQGFAVARGAYIVTTEADSSWGENIVFDFLDKFARDPQYDMIVASPHRPPGGYKNVPFNRVMLSNGGNLILRFAIGEGLTMYTGMCRAYKREVIDTLELDSSGKEIHLEIIYKAAELGFKIGEIPATLAWKSRKRGAGRKSSFNAQKIIASHLRFAFNTSPFMLIGTAGIASLLAAFVIGAMVAADYLFNAPNFIEGAMLPILQLIGILLFFGLQLLVFCYLAYQNRKTQIECYRIIGKVKKLERAIQTEQSRRTDDGR